MGKVDNRKLQFTSAKGRLVEADFEGGQVSSDGGLLLVREVERRSGLIRGVARRIGDGRQAGKVHHVVETMIRQRVIGAIAGWEDLNDANALREDPLHQVAAGQNGALASASTLCRFEILWDLFPIPPALANPQSHISYLRPTSPKMCET